MKKTLCHLIFATAIAGTGASAIVRAQQGTLTARAAVDGSTPRRSCSRWRSSNAR